MWQRILISAFLIALTVWLGFFIQQPEFISILVAHILFFIFYLLVIKKSEQNISFWIAIGILLRIILLFSFPALSNDIYRFYWDGLLSSHGYNPFDHLPGYYIQNNILPEYLTSGLYEKLNSKEYYTIYPPVLQMLFAVAAWLFPRSIVGAGIIMKIFLLAGEIGSIILMRKILPKFNLTERNVLLYALNPLIIVEIMGNLHFEGLMVLFLLLALWWLVKMPHPALLLAAGAMALSVGSKLLPLMFQPFLLFRLRFGQNIIYFLALIMMSVVMFAALLNGLFAENFGSSLNLYFRQFEFNASIYYLARWIGYQIERYNMVKTIGPMLAVLTFLIIIILSIFRRKKSWKSLPESWLFAISIYLLHATTVHPWYIALPVALSIFTNWRYPIVWSGAVVLSYSHYWGRGFEERYGLIGLEYSLVLGFFLWELLHQRSFFTFTKTGG